MSVKCLGLSRAGPDRSTPISSGPPSGMQIWWPLWGLSRMWPSRKRISTDMFFGSRRESHRGRSTAGCAILMSMKSSLTSSSDWRR